MNVTSKYFPILVLGGRGDGIGQGREHARGVSTTGAREHEAEGEEPPIFSQTRQGFSINMKMLQYILEKASI